MANLFDVGIVFALGFLLALISYLGLPEVVRRTAAAEVKTAGTARREIVDPKAVKLQRYRISKESLGGKGVKLGVAYRLASGEVVCVSSPSSSQRPAKSPP